MEHHFNIDYAKEYGIVEAVLINHFQYWLAKNAANHTNYFEGRYWTYNSVHAYSKLFPYLTADKIRRAIEKLVAAGVLLKSNFNQMAMDRTSWYSLCDEMLPNIWQQNQNDLANSPNAFGNDAGALPVNNTTGTIPVNTTDNSSRIINNTSKNISFGSKENKKKGLDLSFIGIEYSEMMCRWLAFHKEIGKPYTQTGAEGAYRRLLTLSNSDPRVADQIVEQSIANGWQGLFEIKQSKQQSNGSNQTTGGFFCQLADTIKQSGGVY